MKKPEKKEPHSWLPSMRIENTQQAVIAEHNQTIDDYEKFLPSEEEIENILIANSDVTGDFAKQTKAISARLHSHKRIGK